MKRELVVAVAAATGRTVAGRDWGWGIAEGGVERSGTRGCVGARRGLAGFET